MNTTPGWYPDTNMPGTRRYFDGEVWTDNVAPIEPEGNSGRQVMMIVVGILVAVAVIWVVYYIAHANDGMNCSLDNLDRAQRGEPTVICPN